MPDATEPAPGDAGAGGALATGGGRSIGIISTTGGGGMLTGAGADGGAFDWAALTGVFFPDLDGGFFRAFSGAGVAATGPVSGVGCWASA